MESEKLNNFFKSWMPSLPEEGAFPEESEDCLSDDRLIKIAKMDPKEWSKHIADHVAVCHHCSGVVYLLKSTERPPNKIYELLNRAQEKANKTTRSMRPSVISQLRSFFSVGQFKWAASALAASLILLSASWWISTKHISPNNNDPVIVSLGEDKYGNTVQWLQASLGKLNDPTIPPKEKQLQMAALNKDVPQINERLASLTGEGLDSMKRANLANLVAAYNSGLTILRNDMAAQKNTPVVHAPKINSTADTDMVVSIYTTAHDSFLPKSAESEKKPRTEVEAAKAVQDGNEQVNVVSIKENEVGVIDLKPNRSSEEAATLQQNINNSLGQRNIKLNFIRAANMQTFAPSGGIPRQ